MAKSQGKVAVAGAGLMGTGIAHGLANAGFDVALVDINPQALEKARTNIDEILAGGVKLGKLTGEHHEQTMARLKTFTSVAEAAKDAELFVETVAENLQIKLAVVKEAETTLAPGAIIGSNTSALSVTEIAAATKHPDRFVGMHFFNPVHKMKLLELVVGLQTTVETLTKARAYGDAMGKTTIVVNESPGLTTSRMSAMAGNEAMYMLQEGIASAEDIDTALRMGFNHPMGPLELGDLTGWDTRLAVLKYLHSTLGEKFRPCPLIIKMVSAGRYGRKTGAGVYIYENGQKVPGSGLKASLL
jgi:3-hydroxybutyryl-CoA dehydrogenase